MGIKYKLKLKDLKIELDTTNDRVKEIKSITENIRSNDVTIAQIISSITQLEKFNTQLETEIQSFEKGDF